MFHIIDWAGNILFDGKRFKTFDEGWDFLLAQFPNEEDEFFEDYFVERI